MNPDGIFSLLSVKFVALMNNTDRRHATLSDRPLDGGLKQLHSMDSNHQSSAQVHIALLHRKPMDHARRLQSPLR